MYKYLILFLLFISMGYQMRAQGIRIASGTTFKVTQAQQTIVLKDGANFFNDAAINGDKLVLKFSGIDTSRIEGSGNLSIARIEMNKPTTAAAKLSKNLSLTERIQFSSGVIDLNGNNILLADTAFLVDESDNSRITGDSGFVQVTQYLDAPLAENPANLGLVITSGADWGVTTIRRSPRKISAAGAVGGIQRSFEVTPEFNTDLSAFLRMYYLDSELDGLTETEIDFYGASTETTGWEHLGRVGGNVTANFVNINGIDSISLLTLSSVDAPLPLAIHQFKGECSARGVVLNWYLEDGQTDAVQYIERSTNGNNWEIAGTVTVEDNVSAYEFIDAGKITTAYYRLKYRAADFSDLYSSVISVNCGEAISSFGLIENPVKSMLRLNVTLAAAQTINASLIDMSGRVFARSTHNLQSGNNCVDLDAATLAAGIYILSINTTDGMSWQQKFVKE